MRTYIALLHKSPGTSYGVTFPDLPGCTSGGRTADQALANAAEALSAHLALMRADGDAIPEPRTIEALRADPAAAEEMDGAIISLVEMRPVAAPKLRVNVMIDPGVLRDADRAAEATGQSRSAFIEAALRAKLTVPA